MYEIVKNDHLSGYGSQNPHNKSFLSTQKHINYTRAFKTQPFKPEADTYLVCNNNRLKFRRRKDN